MIKINLLPIKASKKKETAKQQLLIFLVSVVVVVVAAVALYSTELIKIRAANNELEKSKQEIQRLKTIIGEMENIKKLQDDVKKKLDVLNRLRKEKSGPALRLAKLSDCIPEKLWLTKYTESAGKVSVGGIAYNEDLIAAFMRNLVSSGEFGNVELVSSDQDTVNGIKVKKFDISCILNSYKP